MKYYEVNFDGLVGPSHNYAGLSFGNLASSQNASAVSNPKSAALQGLKKMKALHDLGLKQGFIPPLTRPNLSMLRQLGFSGNEAQLLNKASKQAPHLLAACYSASSMWTANAATISPSLTTHDGKLHFTPANLLSQFHRSIESQETATNLKRIFSDERHFSHHAPLPHHEHFADEGAANHTRLSPNHSEKGIELFVYGSSQVTESPKPKLFPARQTLEASQAIARSHGLDDNDCVFIQQNPEVIDQGVFHNDVIAVGNENVLFYHEQAFYNSAQVLADLQGKWQAKFDSPLYLIEVKTEQIPVSEAVKTYLFNTQIVRLPSSEMAIIAPLECEESAIVSQCLEQIIQQDNPIHQVIYMDVKESMRNGGGPACLRLRVAMNEAELAAVNQGFILSDKRYLELTAWVNKHYPEQIESNQLASLELYNHINAIELP